VTLALLSVGRRRRLGEVVSPVGRAAEALAERPMLADMPSMGRLPLGPVETGPIRSRACRVEPVKPVKASRSSVAATRRALPR
jgi:hypothetical protein